ncbi:MAG TPA: 50S ribosomal protein L15 [Candidatus Omnitrophota bacterium]|nr:50S ribosomal protein L15 [Candidatus Omnitrophota bacterium]
MQVNDIKAPYGVRRRRKIVGRGRGSGHGKTSCRGHKGQKAHSPGPKIMLEGGQVPLIRRIPKVGFNSHRPYLCQVVNVELLNCFTKDSTVNIVTLKEKGLIKSLNKPIKILGDGELKKSLLVQVENISKTAQEKIKKAGGKIEAPIRKADEEARVAGK